MSDFKVVYEHPYGLEKVTSKVYAIENSSFLIANKFGKFEWVHMDCCTLVTED